MPDIVIENGGSEETRPEPAPEPVPTPEPTDATEEAFQAVERWSCLPVYRDGSDWNVSVPPAAVSCGSGRAGLFEVTSTTVGDASCPTGTGRDQWSYHSTVTGTTTTLCLTRIWVRNYCVLAEWAGNTVSSIGHSTAVDCDATQVPVPYKHVMIIAAVYQAPPGANASHCPTSAQDTLLYWSLIANDGGTLVCFTNR